VFPRKAVQQAFGRDPPREVYIQQPHHLLCRTSEGLETTESVTDNSRKSQREESTENRGREASPEGRRIRHSMRMKAAGARGEKTGGAGGGGSIPGCPGAAGGTTGGRSVPPRNHGRGVYLWVDLREPEAVQPHAHVGLAERVRAVLRELEEDERLPGNACVTPPPFVSNALSTVASNARHPVGRDDGHGRGRAPTHTNSSCVLATAVCERALSPAPPSRRRREGGGGARRTCNGSSKAVRHAS